MAAIKICGWVALGLVAAVLQGVAIFWYRGYGGSFFSQTGLECTIIPAFAEAVFPIVVLKCLDEIHGRAVANPHSLLGQSLRDSTPKSPIPPPTRKVWDGGFEDMDDASSKMGKDR